MFSKEVTIKTLFDKEVTSKALGNMPGATCNTVRSPDISHGISHDRTGHVSDLITKHNRANYPLITELI
jgi:hypothetical protein